MEPEVYEVSVLHIENPHNLWVEVKHPNLKIPIWEQIGIYGVLPCMTTLSVTSKLHSKGCDLWQNAAYERMKEHLYCAKKTWFSPSVVICTSIFDKHKFGEIVIEKDNGKLKKLSKILTESGFAGYDAVEFQKKLKNNKLQINLDKEKVKAVIEKIERYYLNKRHSEHFIKALHSQISIFHTAQKLESALTMNNFNRHKKIQTKDRDLSEIKEKKLHIESHKNIEAVEPKESTSRSSGTLNVSNSGDVSDNLKKVNKSTKHEDVDYSAGRACRRHSHDYEDSRTAEMKVKRGHNHSSSRLEDDDEWSIVRQTRRQLHQDPGESNLKDVKPLVYEDFSKQQNDLYHEPVTKIEINEQVVKVKAPKFPGQGVTYPKVNAIEETLVALGPPGYVCLPKISGVNEVSNEDRLLKDKLVSGSDETVISKPSHSKLLRRLGQIREAKVSSDTSTRLSLNLIIGLRGALH